LKDYGFRALPSGTGKGASLLTGPFHLYNRTNKQPIKEASGSAIGSYYNTVEYFTTVQAGPASSRRARANGPIDKRAAKYAMLPRYPAEKSGLW
jgi:hypothetical protein